MFVAAVALAGLRAQCGTQWLPGDAFAGADSGVTAATRWDPDGPGPSGELMVIAGWFHVVGAVRTR